MAVLNMTGAGSSKPAQEKTITVTSNGTSIVMPDTGNTLSKVTVVANVPVSGATLYITSSVASVNEFANELTIAADTVLADSISLSHLNVSNTVTSVTRIDNLSMRLGLSNLVAGTPISIQLLSSCYKNNNGNSTTISVPVIAATIASLINTTSGMTIVRNNVYTDEGTDTCVMTKSWPGCGTAVRNACNSFTISANSYVTINNIGQSTANININQRDASMYYVWKQEGTVRGLDFIKFRWRGASVYNGSVDTEWELLLFGNGDACINLVQQGATWNGAFNFLGTTYTLNSSNPTLSFYRDNWQGSTFTVANGLYDVSQHNPASDTPWQTGTLSSLYTDYNAPYIHRYNSKNDDETDTINIIMPWSYGGTDRTSLYISGNSWIGIGASAENVKMNRRDAAVYYEQVRYVVLTDANNIQATQIVWGGASSYNGSIDQWWSLWLFANGDAMIHIKQLGGTTGGTSSFYNDTFIAATDAIYSFYRNDSAGTTWTVEAALYDITKHRI